jgi:hypothetical protein
MESIEEEEMKWIGIGNKNVGEKVREKLWSKKWYKFVENKWTMKIGLI